MAGASGRSLNGGLDGEAATDATEASAAGEARRVLVMANYRGYYPLQIVVDKISKLYESVFIKSPVPFGAGVRDEIPKFLQEETMKTLNASQSSSPATPASRFDSARALAFSLAEADGDLLEPELVAWIDRSAAKASPVLEGCGGPDGWHNYGVSHGGRLEVDVDGEASFIFAESSPFDSYAHFSPGPFINRRDAQGNETLCRIGGVDCVSLDDWTSKLT